MFLELTKYHNNIFEIIPLKLKEAIRKEEDMKQRSKVSWLRLGDSNTRFFSTATKNREGNKKVTRAKMEENSMGYFRELYGSTNRPHPTISIIFPNLVSEDMNKGLTLLPLEEEFRVTLYSFSSAKSPRLDGHTSEFFKKF